MSFPIGMPLLFVFLWSSAYIAIEFCSAHIEPATFVVLRSVITATVLALVVITAGLKWPGHWLSLVHCSIVGVLIHGVYGVGAFAAIYHGLDAGLAALILSFQPLLTVLLSSLFLGEKITNRKVIGVLVGFFGVAIVLLHGSVDAIQLIFEGDSSRSGNKFFAVSACFIALVAISTATITQKEYCSEIHPIAGTCIQYAAAAVVILPIALSFETMQISWNLNFVLGLGWLVVFVSIGAMALLMMLIKQGEAGSVSNLFYLVTPLVTIKAWILFGDEITLAAVFGMLLCMMGVVIVTIVPVPKPVMNRAPSLA